MKRLVALFLLLLTSTVHAEVAVLIHGYLGDARSWEKSNITTILEQNGWQSRGVLASGQQPGIVLGDDNRQLKATDKCFYRVVLPFKAPLEVQAEMLQNILNAVVNLHPNEPITLIGHSAGGLVARLTLVLYGKGQVSRLITIAAPHLGTPRAIQALDAADDSGMFGFVKNFFGGADYQLVKSSKRLLMELVPPRPGNYLDGLNYQPHPDIQYVSIIRTTPVGRDGDLVVPGYSQDMNNIPALAGKSFVYKAPAVHFLVPQDGILLALMLNGGQLPAEQQAQAAPHAG